MDQLKFLDLFAGCGGLSLGLTSAGWRGVLAVEKDPMAFETLSSNLLVGGRENRFDWPPDIPKEPMLIQTLLSDHEPHLARLRGKVDLIAGGPPCQGFSFAGKRNALDPRNQMLKQYMKVVGLVRPKLLLVENVKGITVRHGKKDAAYVDVLLQELTALGYVCEWRIVRAADYCVPQERPRFILVGVNKDLFPDIDVGHSLPALWDAALQNGRESFLRDTGLSGRPISSRDALSDLEVAHSDLMACVDAPRRFQIVYKGPRTKYQKLLHTGVNSDAMNSMRLANHAPATIARFGQIQKNCRSGVTLKPADMAGFATKKQAQVVLHQDKPSHTLTTLPDDLLHYDEPRILTVREYARLQSFPDWFQFHGKYTTGGASRSHECPRYTQIGNAVAPFVAQVLGYAVANLLVQFGEITRRSDDCIGQARIA